MCPVLATPRQATKEPAPHPTHICVVLDVEACHVHPCIDQLSHGLGLARGWADGGHDLGGPDAGLAGLADGLRVKGRQVVQLKDGGSVMPWSGMLLVVCCSTGAPGGIPGGWGDVQKCWLGSAAYGAAAPG